MYKTVRHGENSLQYTILPQTEEVLNNSGLMGKGRDYSPSIHVRSRKKTTLKLFIFVIFGALFGLAVMSLPVTIMSAALSVYVRSRNPQDHREVVTTASIIPTGREIVKSRKKELKFVPEFVTTVNPKLETTTQSTVTSTSLPTTVNKEMATTPPWTMPALRSWKGFTTSTTLRPVPTEVMEEIPLIGTPSGSVRLLDNYMSVKPWEKDIIIRPTVTPEPVTIRNVFKYYSRSYVTSDKSVYTKIFDDVLITTRATTARPPVITESTTALSLDEDDEFKESLEVDEVFSLPPLKPESAVPVLDSDEVTVSKAGGDGWYGTRWPFVDTSSYFQWTSYSLSDNLLLPLLVAAISSIVLVLLLGLAVRRRKRATTTSAQIGKLTADLQADDNTNLLQAENPEEADE